MIRQAMTGSARLLQGPGQSFTSSSEPLVLDRMEPSNAV
jgi:hypothetical protein